MQEIPKVLILDMDEELISTKTKLLEEDGIAVISSSDARDVLGRLDQIDPDLIIIGTEVPMINGELPLTLFRRIPGRTGVHAGTWSRPVYFETT